MPVLPVYQYAGSPVIHEEYSMVDLTDATQVFCAISIASYTNTTPDAHFADLGHTSFGDNLSPMLVATSRGNK